MSVEHGDERVQQLMMAALDGELDGEGRADFERRLAADPELRVEWRRHQKLKELMMTSTLSNPPQEPWGTYWRSVYNRVERGAGWILVSVGAMVLTAYGLWQALDGLLADTDIPGFVKLAILALGTGSVVLLFSVAREKLFVRRQDPFKEVER